MTFKSILNGAVSKTENESQRQQRDIDSIELSFGESWPTRLLCKQSMIVSS